jgi:hypothetical protein
MQTLAVPVAAISVRDVQTAVRVLFPVAGELAKHAISEGNKAVHKFKTHSQLDPYLHRMDPSAHHGRSGMALCTGLECNPEHVALVAGRLTHQFPMQAEAAIYLAAVVEYILAEVLELAGNKTRDDHRKCYSSRHIMLAIEADAELAAMFAKCWIRESGVTPHIHRILNDDWSIESTTSPFETLMKHKVRATRNAHCDAYFVDPRTGLHTCLRVCSDDDEEEERDWLEPAPLLDALAEQPQATRRALAQVRDHTAVRAVGVRATF